MDSQSIKPKRPAFLWLGCACVVAILMSQASSAAQQTAGKATAATQAKAKTFDTPDQAAEALVKAAGEFRNPSDELLVFFRPEEGGRICIDSMMLKEMIDRFAKKA